MIITNNETFYPTPNELVDKMLSKLSRKEIWKIRDILEPSAGDGRLADAIIKRCHISDNYQAKVDCVEIDDTLSATLKGKEYRVVSDDFLNFTTKKHYDLILMNPPFNKGAEHLWKAIKLAEDNGGDTNIICLLNAETIKNAYTNTRKSLATILSKYNAKIDFVENAFISSERKTYVEVAVVSLYVPTQKFYSFLMDDLEKAEDVAEDTSKKPSEIVTDNAIAQSVAYYNKEVELITSFLKEYLSIKPYIGKRFLCEEDDNLLKSIKSEPIVEIKDVESYSDINKVLEKIRYKYWEHLFHNKEFTKALTSDMQQTLRNSIADMQNYEYSLHNIEVVKREFIGKMLENINESILNLFEKLSAENTWYVGSQNIHYYNGWKSNKAHKVNKKVIIPMNGAFAASWSIEYLNTYRITETITDIEKVFNYLNSEENSFLAPAYDVIAKANKNCQSKDIQFKYFSITLYKKGTCHIKFTNTDVLDALNIYVGRQKNWLPPSYGKVAYDDMTSEEKQVIDEFQGKEEYAKVFANPSKYIFETSQMLALTDGGNK